MSFRGNAARATAVFLVATLAPGVARVAHADTPPAAAGTAPSDSPSAPAPAPGGVAPAPPPVGPVAGSGSPSAQSDAADKKSHDQVSSYMWRAGGWVSIAIGAGAALVALGTGYVMLHDNGVRNSDCPGHICHQQGFDANSQLDSLAGWNAGAWAVAIVGLGVGAFLVITHPPGSESDKGSAGTTAIGVSPNGSGLGLNVRSTF